MKKSAFLILSLGIVFSSESLLASSLLTELFVGTSKRVSSSSTVMRKTTGRTLEGLYAKKNKTPVTKRFYSTSSSAEEEKEKLMKKLQIVGFGKKDLKFDPKASMYYYDEEEPADVSKTELHAPEKKVHDTFVEFSVKKKVNKTESTFHSPDKEYVLLPNEQKIVSDKRQKVEEPYLFPWSLNGHLEMTFRTGADKYRRYIGSGILIEDDLVLTAGHCLFLGEYGPVHEVTFYPGRNGNTSSSIAHHKKIFIPKEWESKQHEDHDIGLIVLETKQSEKNYSILKILSDDELIDLDVRISGYPGERRDENNLPYMFTMTGPIKSVKRNKFYYHVDTSGGQSGSGVLIEKDFRQFVNTCIGIHVTGCQEEGNGAIRINDEKYKMIQEWIKRKL